MSKFISRKYLYSLILSILLVGMQAVFAQNFNNNLLKADVNKNSLGGVKVTLYTSKPYKDSVVANKKSDNEYVILMPETANSLTSKPSLNSASDIVRNVEVKTQQYNGNVKGYTKIVITTTKPVEVVPQVQTLNTSSYALSEKEYKELLTQSTKNKNVVKKEIKPIVAVKKEVVAKSPVKTTAKPLQKNAALATSKISNKLKAVTAEAPKKSKTLRKEKTYEKITTIKKHKNISPRRVAQKTEPVVKRKLVAKPLAVTKKSEEKKVVQSSQPPIAPVVEQKVATAPVVQQPVPHSTSITPVETKKTIINKPQANNSRFHQIGIVLTEYVPGLTQERLHKIKTLVTNNLYNLIAAISIGFIVLLLIARKMTKSIKAHKQDFLKNLEDKPFVPSDIESKISEDMTWKEKFQTYVDATSPDVPEQEEVAETTPVVSNEDLDELFGSEIPEEITSTAESEVVQMNSEVSTLIEEAEDILTAEEEVKQTIVPDRLESDSFLSELDQVVGGTYNIKEEASFEDIFGEDEDIGIPEAAIQSPEATYDEVEDIFEEELAENELIKEGLLGEKFIENEVEEFGLNAEDTAFPYPPLEPVPPVVSESPFESVVEAEPDEVVKSEFEIDEGKYFYLVDYDDKTSLIGQIDDEIFVLKSFDSRVDDKLQARLNEQKGGTSSYMTRVGNYKALVEVTPDNMNLLIEL